MKRIEEKAILLRWEEGGKAKVFGYTVWDWNKRMPSEREKASVIAAGRSLTRIQLLASSGGS